jgi:hypothetical protein
MAPDAESAEAGITYFEHPVAPGLKMFRCTRYAADITVKSCSGRWRKAKDAPPWWSQYEQCRRCPLGAFHDGQGLVRYSRHHANMICPRCGKGTTRMIGGSRCVSCYNRERELRAGRNARGNAPVELMQRPIHTIELLVEAEGVIERFRDPGRRDLTESVVQYLRVNTGRIAFAFAAPGMGRIRAKVRMLARQAAERRRQVVKYRAGLFSTSALGRLWVAGQG